MKFYKFSDFFKLKSMTTIETAKKREIPAVSRGKK